MWVQIHAGLFSASHEARRRMAVCTRQQTGNRTKPASRGTRCATAVTPRPTRMSLYDPARLRRAVQGAGALPLRLLQVYLLFIKEVLRYE